MFASFFGAKEYKTLLDKEVKIDPRVIPKKAIDQLLKPNQQKQCLKQLTTKTKNGFKIMRRLTFCHLLLMYSSSFYGLIQKFIDCQILSSDQWLNEQNIKPYYFFLRKVLSSTQMYNKTKQPFQTFSFEKQFYIYNILYEMFKIIVKMPLLGRYYKDSNPQVTCSFVETLAVQAQKLYLPWKSGLQQLFNNPKQYISGKADEELVKVVIEECLPYLNQEMKKLFLDKYFYPYGKGIGIRLYRTEEQTEQITKIMNGILFDHKQTERRQAQQQLEKTLFPEEGKFNYAFFEESFAPDMKKGNNREQINVSDEDDEIVHPVKFQDTTIKEKDQKETGYQLEYCEDV